MDAPPTPIPPTAPPPLLNDVRHEREAAPAPDPAEALPVAQGQELLGPCPGCGGYWTRAVKRGRKPETCPACKAEGPPGGR